MNVVIENLLGLGAITRTGRPDWSIHEENFELFGQISVAPALAVSGLVTRKYKPLELPSEQIYRDSRIIYTFSAHTGYELKTLLRLQFF